MSEKTINHISWSMLRTFENDKEQFHKTYILWERFEGNQYTEFWKEYEKILWENEYKDYDSNIYFEFNLLWYKILWYKDFENKDEIIEVKTKSWWWSKNAIQKDWQFRIYNHIKGNKIFKIHQHNKKLIKDKIEDIGWQDENFEIDIFSKIQDIEKYLNIYWFVIKNYERQ